MKKLKIYLANIWDELLSERGLVMLEKKYIIGGNWLTGARNYKLKSYNPNLLIYAPSKTKGSLNLSISILKQLPTIMWALFPDYILGWDFLKKDFLFKISPRLIKQFSYCRCLLSNSLYTKKLLERALPNKFKFINCYLGIDIRGILLEKINESKNRIFLPQSVNILWNHMWKIDKNFLGALKIIKFLAPKYKNVGFYMGRKESWGESDYSPSCLKKEYIKFCDWMKKYPLNNIFFVESMPYRTYWGFISQMDIAFSVSYHESFGISILEQAATGLACIIPNELVYKEIFKSYKGLVSRKRIQSSIELVLKNSKMRAILQQSAPIYAKRFKIEHTINQLSKIINIILNS